MARQGMSEAEKNSLRRSLNIPSPAPASGGGARPPAKPSLSPLAKAAKPKKKTPLVPRPRTTAQRQPPPRQQVAPPPSPPAPAPSVQQPLQADDGMLGETMNAIQQRQQMLQGLKRGGPVKKKAAPRRVVRAKRRR